MRSDDNATEDEPLRFIFLKLMFLSHSDGTTRNQFWDLGELIRNKPKASNAKSNSYSFLTFTYVLFFKPNHI